MPRHVVRHLVHVNLPEECLDWTLARTLIRKQYPSARIGQLSRTTAYPDCTDTCTDECGHVRIMRYTAYITREIRRTANAAEVVVGYVTYEIMPPVDAFTEH